MSVRAEELSITKHNDVYPGIDINGRLSGAAKDKVVYITGASKGIGEATAKTYARAGADTLFLTARSVDLLTSLAASIASSSPSVKVEVRQLDVTDEPAVAQSIKRCIELFGRLDIVIANAGYLGRRTKIGDIDPTEWWRTWDVSMRGSFNVVHNSIHALVKSTGYIVLLSSVAAQRRRPGASGYQTCKHALNRFAEFIHAEYSEEGVRVFAIHPGNVPTELATAEPSLIPILTDKVDLPSHAIVRLTSGSEDWLSGRYVSCNWDLDELATKRKEIEEHDLLKNRLDIGSLGDP